VHHGSNPGCSATQLIDIIAISCFSVAPDRYGSSGAGRKKTCFAIHPLQQICAARPGEGAVLAYELITGNLGETTPMEASYYLAKSKAGRRLAGAIQDACFIRLKGHKK
jgi:hypothetical protein